MARWRGEDGFIQIVNTEEDVCFCSKVINNEPTMSALRGVSSSHAHAFLPIPWLWMVGRNQINNRQGRRGTGLDQVGRQPGPPQWQI